MITRIASKIKGLQVDVQPGAVNLIVGPNFSGKTAILDALRIGLHGYHPATGKQPGRTLLFGKDYLAVALHWSDGHFTDRKFEAGARGVQTSGDRGEIIPPTSINAAEYFALTGPQQIELVAQLLHENPKPILDSMCLELSGLVIPPQTQTARILTDAVIALKGLTAQSLAQWFAVATDFCKANLTIAKKAQEAHQLQLAELGKQSRVAADDYTDSINETRGALENIKAQLARWQVYQDLETQSQVPEAEINRLTMLVEQAPATQQSLDSYNLSHIANLISLTEQAQTEGVCPVCLRKAGKHIKQRLSELVNQANKLEQETQKLEALKKEQTEASAKLQAIRDTQNYLRKLAKPAMSKAELDGWLENLTADLARLEAKQQQFLAAQTVRKEIARIEGDYTLAVHQVLVFDQLLTEIKRYRHEHVEASIGRLLPVARRFCDGILPGVLDFDETGELGLRRNNLFVSHRTFSGTEQSIVYVAWSVALAAARGDTYKVVIIDELGRLDALRKRQLLTRLVELQAGAVIDQAFLCDVELPQPTSEPIKGLSILTCTETETKNQ